MTPSLTKRTSYLEWEEYFMAIAFLSAQRSKDPRTQVGACIVNEDKKIVGIGYNGMPLGCSDDKMPWNKATDEEEGSWLESKTPYVCHAELNAVLNKNLADIKGCVIYVALFPCNTCAQIIIQSGIKEVIYYSDKYNGQAKFIASRRLLDTAGIKYRQFRPRQKQIVIDFDCIEESTPSNIIDIKSKKRNSSSQPIKMENTSNDVTDRLCESINLKSRNHLLVSKSNSEGLAINNNNKGVPKEFKLEDHMEQQHMPLHPNDEPALQVSAVSLPSMARDEYLEFKYAALATFLIVFVAFCSWYLSHCKLLITSSS